MLDSLKAFWAMPIAGFNGFTLTIGVGVIIAAIVYVAFFRK